MVDVDVWCGRGDVVCDGGVVWWTGRCCVVEGVVGDGVVVLWTCNVV